MTVPIEDKKKSASDTKKTSKKNSRKKKAPTREIRKVEFPGMLASKLAGDGESTILPRLSQGKVYVDFETDIANFKTKILDLMAMYLITDNVVDKWNATQVDNFEDLIVYGAQLLVELKHQYTQIAYVPTLTRSDTTAGSTFKRASLLALMLEVAQEIKVPAVCYNIAELYTPVLEIKGTAYYQGKPSSFFMPFRPHKTLAQVETLLTTITGLYDAIVYASQSKTALIPVSTQWVRNIVELPYLSWYGNLLGSFWPINYDNIGSETETFIEIDETTDIFYLEPLGVPEYFDALALYRSASCADSPKFLTVESIANNYISIQTAAINASSFTEVAKTSRNYDWLSNVAKSRSEQSPSPFNNYLGSNSNAFPSRNHKENVMSTPDAWNLMAAMWLKRHFATPGLKHLALHDIGRDLTASILRRSGHEASSPTPDAAPGNPANPYQSPSGESYGDMAESGRFY